MANHNPNQSTRFGQGQPSNVGGRKPLPEELRNIKSLTPQMVAKIISKYAQLTLEDLEVKRKEPATTVLEHAFISIFKKCIEQGDFTRLSFMFDRSIGKAPNDIADDSQDERTKLARLSIHELLQLVETNLPKAS